MAAVTMNRLSGPIGPRPFDPGMDSGERPRLAFETIFHHRQVKRRKPGHISIGIDDEMSETCGLRRSMM